MAALIFDIKKKRGRPPKPGGVDPGVFVRLPSETLASLNAYAEEAGISRSEVMRQLIEAGLRKWRSR